MTIFTMIIVLIWMRLTLYFGGCSWHKRLFEPLGTLTLPSLADTIVIYIYIYMYSKYYILNIKGIYIYIYIYVYIVIVVGDFSEQPSFHANTYIYY